MPLPVEGEWPHSSAVGLPKDLSPQPHPVKKTSTSQAGRGGCSLFSHGLFRLWRSWKFPCLPAVRRCPPSPCLSLCCLVNYLFRASWYCVSETPAPFSQEGLACSFHNAEMVSAGSRSHWVPPNTTRQQYLQLTLAYPLPSLCAFTPSMCLVSFPLSSEPHSDLAPT